MGAVSRSLPAPLPALAPTSGLAPPAKKNKTASPRAPVALPPVEETPAEPIAAPVALEPAAPLSPDAQLLIALRAGDPQALDTVVRTHQAGIHAYLRARLFEPSDAEDLTQEVFLRCCDGRVAFEHASGLQSWLIGIARNILREHLRGQAKRREVMWTELCLELDEFTQRKEGAAEVALTHLPDCLESLGQSAREALDMRYSSELKSAEIATRLKRSEGAVKLLMFRARQALKNCLDHKLQAERHG